MRSRALRRRGRHQPRGEPGAPEAQSLDNGPPQTFDVHKMLLGADRYGLENLGNLSTIPPRGPEAAVGLIPWEEGSGGPCRVIARW